MSSNKIRYNNTEEDFERWLISNGAEILKPTNIWEFSRFKVPKGGVCVVYQNKRRRFSFSDDQTSEYFNAYRSKKNIRIIAKKPRSVFQQKRDRLIKRDGFNCFFCHKPMDSSDDPCSIEHLLSTSVGGTNNDHNLVLAHTSCNNDAANKSIIEKIKIREANLL